LDFELNEAEARVLGCLLEKEAATPEYYPLSLNALTNACNQKSNRDPVVSYDDSTVEEALENLRSKRLAVRISGPDMRVPKHAHRLSEVFNLGRREQAMLCVLLLRGPQTPGELRGRTERMYAFDDLAAVESCLQRLIEWTPDPLVTKLPRQAGFKEPRYAHLLCGPVESVPELAPLAAEPEPDRLARLESAVDALQSDVAALRRRVDEFLRQFE
jgi:uncharacterized protein YceH (UPF0502 family)